MVDAAHLARMIANLDFAITAAPVAELVDAMDSKSIVREDVPVRVRPGAPFYISHDNSLRSCLL